MLNTNAASLYDKIETCEKSNCLIHTISLVIIYLLLLAVVSIGCCYYYTRDWIKKEHMLSYNIIWQIFKKLILKFVR